jgi:uncharacterized protein (TIGR03435 family)
MKKIVLWVITFAALLTGSLHAQTLAGDWQGTLKAGKDLRIVLKIAKDDKSVWKATMYSIDQTPQPFTGNDVKVDGPAIKFSVLTLGATYEGKLAADGNALNGTYTQAGKDLPLNFVRATKETAWVIPEPPVKLPPMAKDAKPVFEVATIKLSKPEQMGKGFGINGHQCRTINTSLADLIEFAYNVQVKQIVNAPDWLDGQKYDIAGHPDVEGQPNYDQLKLMIQSLLADRFKLTFHRDRKELSVFALSVGKTGSKLKVADESSAASHTLNFHPGAKGGLILTIRYATINEIGQALQQTMLDRPIADQTGLRGKYEFDVTFMPDDSMMGGIASKLPPPPAGAEMPPSLFTAFQDQLGLKLEPTKAPVEVLVVDHVEKPSED